MKNTKKQLVEMVEELDGEKEFWSNEYHDLKMKVDWGSLEDYCSRIDELITKNNDIYKENGKLNELMKDALSCKKLVDDFMNKTKGFTEWAAPDDCDGDVVKYAIHLEEEIDELKKENETFNGKPSVKKLKKKINELKEEISGTEHYNGCIDDEMESVEKLMKIFTDDGELPGEETSCLGCRLRRFANFTIAIIRDNKNLTDKLVQTGMSPEATMPVIS
jgi:hypothetical protein